MRFYITTLFIFLSVLLYSCKKNSAVITVPAPDVNYKVELRMLWQSPNFSVPASNAHFTSFIGMIHKKDTFLWKPNGLATVGMEYLAEVGSYWRLNNEIDSMIARGKTLTRFEIPAPAITGNYDTIINISLLHPCFSFASMIAPSPDWFIGLNQFSLLQNNKWVNDITLPLYPMDAGTEDGDAFGYNNPASVPQQIIRLLTPAEATVLANGNSSFAAMATIRFTRL